MYLPVPGSLCEWTSLHTLISQICPVMSQWIMSSGKLWDDREEAHGGDAGIDHRLLPTTGTTRQLGKHQAPVSGENRRIWSEHKKYTSYMRFLDMNYNWLPIIAGTHPPKHVAYIPSKQDALIFIQGGRKLLSLRWWPREILKKNNTGDLVKQSQICQCFSVHFFLL